MFFCLFQTTTHCFMSICFFSLIYHLVLLYSFIHSVRFRIVNISLFMAQQCILSRLISDHPLMLSIELIHLLPRLPFPGVPFYYSQHQAFRSSFPMAVFTHLSHFHFLLQSFLFSFTCLGP